MSDHARYSPSSASRWMTCRGSIALTRDIPNPTSKYAAEGTAAHTFAARALTYGKQANFYLNETTEVEGWVFTCDEEMALHVQLYLDEVRSRVKDGTLLHEQRVSFSKAIGVPDQSGTSDAIVLSGDGKRVDIGDLKYGMGVKVIAAENKQLMTYAVGVLEEFETIMSDVQEVVLFIVQPRLDHIDEWKCSIERLNQHKEDMAVAAGVAEYVLQNPGKVMEFLTVDETACRFCPAKSTCPALRQHVALTVADDFQALDNPGNLLVNEPLTTPDKLGEVFGVLDIIEDWCRAVRSEVERRVCGGMTVIGLDGKPMKLIEGKKGNRKWADAKQAEALLVGLLPRDQVYEPEELRSPAKIGKLLDKKATAAQWETIKPLIVQAAGKPKVVFGSVEGIPYAGDAGADEFTALEE